MNHGGLLIDHHNVLINHTSQLYLQHSNGALVCFDSSLLISLAITQGIAYF